MLISLPKRHVDDASRALTARQSLADAAIDPGEKFLENLPDLFIEQVAEALDNKDLFSLGQSCRALQQADFFRRKGVEAGIQQVASVADASEYVRRHASDARLIRNLRLSANAGAQKILWPWLTQAKDLRAIDIEGAVSLPAGGLSFDNEPLWPKLRGARLRLVDIAASCPSTQYLADLALTTLHSLHLSVSDLDLKNSLTSWTQFADRLTSAWSQSTLLTTLNLDLKATVSTDFEMPTLTLPAGLFPSYPSSLMHLTLRLSGIQKTVKDVLDQFAVQLSRLTALRELCLVLDRVDSFTGRDGDLGRLALALPPSICRLHLDFDWTLESDDAARILFSSERPGLHRLEELRFGFCDISIDRADGRCELDLISALSHMGQQRAKSLSFGVCLVGGRQDEQNPWPMNTWDQLQLPNTMTTVELSFTYVVSQHLQRSQVTKTFSHLMNQIPTALSRMTLRLDAAVDPLPDHEVLAAELAAVCRRRFEHTACQVFIAA